MEISFDPAKRMKTLMERGLDFTDVEKIFDGSTFSFEDDRVDYPEVRVVTFGLLFGRMITIVWTRTEFGRRIISMRKANGREQAKYQSRMG